MNKYKIVVFFFFFLKSGHDCKLDVLLLNMTFFPTELPSKYLKLICVFQTNKQTIPN